MTDLRKLEIIMPTKCPRCISRHATIETGRGGTMRPALFCICGKHLGWVSDTVRDYLTDIVKRFGRPTEPIEVRPPSGAGDVTNSRVEKEPGKCQTH